MEVVAMTRRAIKGRGTIRVLSVLVRHERTVPRKTGMNPTIIALTGPPITRRGTEKEIKDLGRKRLGQMTK